VDEHELAYLEEDLSKAVHVWVERAPRLRASLPPADFACWLLVHRLARLKLLKAAGTPALLLDRERALVHEAMVEAVRLLASEGGR
jgi:hypothetical protein